MDGLCRIFTKKDIIVLIQESNPIPFFLALLIFIILMIFNGWYFKEDRIFLLYEKYMRIRKLNSKMNRILLIFTIYIFLVIINILYFKIICSVLFFNNLLLTI